MKEKTVLSINLNKIALIRNARGRNYPDLAYFARCCLDYGAGGVTIHPRPDQRHARYDDVTLLKQVVDEYTGKELNIEGYPTNDFLDVVLASRPHQCTLVPDAPDQVTSDHGWDLPQQQGIVVPVIKELKSAGIRVSIFMDPDAQLMSAAAATGTDRIELYTEAYAQAYDSADEGQSVRIYEQAATAARLQGLGVNAGHDLNLHNLGRFLTIEGILEVSIGHALTVEALELGLESTVSSYLNVIDQAAALKPA